jgi:hypothetical protein
VSDSGMFASIQSANLDVESAYFSTAHRIVAEHPRCGEPSQPHRKTVKRSRGCCWNKSRSRWKATPIAWRLNSAGRVASQVVTR